MRYTKLIWILWQKEIKHWSRMFDMLGAIHSVSGKLISWPILSIIISFFRYCFAGMHFLFETFLFVFNREQFNENMRNLERALK